VWKKNENAERDELGVGGSAQKSAGSRGGPRPVMGCWRHCAVGSGARCRGTARQGKDGNYFSKGRGKSSRKNEKTTFFVSEIVGAPFSRWFGNEPLRHETLDFVCGKRGKGRRL